MLLVVIFLGMTLVSFAIVALATRETPRERLVRERVHRLLVLRPEEEPGLSPGTMWKETKTGLLPWLDTTLEGSRPAVALNRLLLEAASPWTLGTFALYSAAAGAAFFLPAYFFLPVLPLDTVLLLAGFFSPYIYLRFRRGRRLKAFNDGLADAIDLMSRALRAGHSLASSIEVLAEQAPPAVAQEFQAVFRQQNFGLPIRDALLELSGRVPSKDLRFLVTAMLVQKETGGNLIEILERTAHVIRERLRIEGEVRTRTAQGRLTGWILSLLPVILLVLLNVINPGYSTILLDDPTGRKLLYAGAVLIALGSFIISRIVDIEV